MYLGSPLLPMNISSQKGLQDFKEALAKKNWIDVEASKESLILVPYFLYNYHYYLEQHKDGTSIIKDSYDGVLAIDGHAIKIEEDKVDLIKYNWAKSVQVVPKEEFDEKWNNIDKKEQTEIIKLKTAEYFDVPKQNVIITAVRKVLVPFFVFKATLEDVEYKVQMDVIDGKMYGIKEIPIREKGALEVTKETLNELRTPANWVRYTKEIAAGTFAAGKNAMTTGGKKESKSSDKKTTTSSGFDLSFFARPEILVLIMLLALLLIYLAVFV